MAKRSFMRWRVVFALLALAASPALGHIGSPDVYFDGFAGRYHLLVTVRPPAVIPGIAEIEIRCLDGDVRELRIVPLRINGPGADLAPTPDLAQGSPADPQFFTGRLWIMARGSWKIRIQADGAAGPAELSVPVPAVAVSTLPMQRALGTLLGALGLLLAVSLVCIVGAGAREATLEPGEPPASVARRKARIPMVVALVLVAGFVYVGDVWWKSSAAGVAKQDYKPPRVEAALQPGGSLLLHLSDPNGKGWSESVMLDDLIPDHGHLMHLFLIRMPAMDSFWHLHPAQTATGVFSDALPNIPAGHYEIFADVVHATGFPETFVGQIDLPEVAGQPLAGDDSGGAAPTLALGAAAGNGDASQTAFSLADGTRILWLRDSAPLRARQTAWLRFRVEGADGRPAGDLEPYMGMAGHMEIVGADLSVFAHIHPAGSVSMAALDLAQGGAPSAAGPSADSAAQPGMMMQMDSSRVAPEVSFPYGFPKAGQYRMFVQVKRAGRVETGVFDVRIEN
jgi:hypothetical protein